jgi:hypothetical protein
MRRTAAAVFVVCACAGVGYSASGAASGAEGLVLYRPDLPRGYQYGDDSGCGAASAAEGDWPMLRPLFARERPETCAMQLEWAWKTKPRYPPTITSAAYVFRDVTGARSAFAARDELATYTASLTVRSRAQFGLADEAQLLRGPGLNHSASGVVWRHGNVVAVLVVEPANDAAARALARKQQGRLERPSAPPPAQRRNDPALELDDPSLKLPVYWLGRALDPPGELPTLELELSNVGGNGPGQSVQLWYRGGITLDIWRYAAWRRFQRTRLGRLIWDSPCALKRVVPVKGGRAELFHGYGTPKPVGRPCPDRQRDRVIAHVYYRKVVVAVNMPYCYACASARPHPYNTVAGMRTAVLALRVRRA